MTRLWVFDINRDKNLLNFFSYSIAILEIILVLKHVAFDQTLN